MVGIENWKAAEKKAYEAIALPAFPINLADIRNAVSTLLNEVGRYGFFDEYTDHSFRHVESMLDLVDWIIPYETQDSMTSGDWLMLVLSIYFHDLGLLISKNEFEKRSFNSEYLKFVSNPLVSSEKHKEFKARLAQLSQDQADRIMYQDFVRYSHGQRIRQWLEGVYPDEDDGAKEVREAIGGLVSKLDQTIRRDLGVICESHTKDDITDIAKYKVSKPYGSNSDETVNLQYVAVILRTVDLLQITKGRAPTILFQVISPTDPVSQVEWLKQGAVRAVRAQPGQDREGNASSEILSDTIEIHANFSEADGFFGLTSYLAYAQGELQACYAAISKSSRHLTKPPRYPWRYIDSTHVETAGFMAESFGFTLDQQKILDLLTGHTLYNDTTVVLRELTQNALDAVRLQAVMENAPSQYKGRISLHWDSKDRVLTVTDNGTGMSQDVIENHLLKVGSSRYQDPQFKEKFPNFSSISRFGIGVLSAFMVSDDVQITTCSPEDEDARRIELRSVHGKYLIKLLNKVSDKKEIGVFPNGTSVRLALRPTANIGDIVSIARMWLVFPKAKVTVQVDDGAVQEIGYSSPKAALESHLKSAALRYNYRRDVEVREETENGVTLAFAVGRGDLFKDWSYLQVNRERAPLSEALESPPIATCIEGVGVEFNTPGFQNVSILAVANCVGPTAPKTNVARSAFEDTAQYRDMLATIYRLYARHITREVERLTSDEGYSLSRAVGEAPYISAPLLKADVSPQKSALMADAIADTPVILIEAGKQRKNISYKDLHAQGEFWTVESALSRSIENFVKEAPSNVTADAILATLGNSSAAYPSPMTMCNFSSSSYHDDMISKDFEIAEIDASESLRRMNLKWVKREPQRPRWLNSAEIYRKIIQVDRLFWSSIMEVRERSRNARQFANDGFNVGLTNLNSNGLSGYGGFISNRGKYINAEEPISKWFAQLTSTSLTDDETRVLSAAFVAIDHVTAVFYSWSDIEMDHLRRSMEATAFGTIERVIPAFDTFIAALKQSNSRFFDPFAWDRTLSGFGGIYVR